MGGDVLRVATNVSNTGGVRASIRRFVALRFRSGLVYRTYRVSTVQLALGYLYFSTLAQGSRREATSTTVVLRSSRTFFGSRLCALVH